MPSGTTSALLYHLDRLSARPFLAVVLAISLLICAARPATAELAHAGLHAAAASRPDWSANDYPILSARTKLKHKPEVPEIYQVDRHAIGDRRPLLLVHGLKGEYWRHFRWDKVIRRFLDYPDFDRHYKIYLLRYDTSALLEKTIPKFKESLLKLRQQTGGKQVSILALSLGGNLAKEAMADPEVDQAVRLVFTLATPHRGSALFSADWLQYSLYENMYLPWTKVDHALSYRIYFKLNPNLVKDLSWDNCDLLLPETGRFRSKLPLGPRGDLTAANDGNPKLFQLNEGGKIDKSKFITYAGYMLNPYMAPTIKRELELVFMYPLAMVAWKVPSHIAREHPVLKSLNRDITRVVPRRNADGEPLARLPYALNDGITPVNSALFLSAQACRKHPLSSEEALSQLNGAIDVRLARVFRNVDHLTFIDSRRPRPGSPLLRDELDHKAGLRTMFDWILSDLMQSQEADSALAKQPDKEPSPATVPPVQSY